MSRTLLAPLALAALAALIALGSGCSAASEDEATSEDALNPWSDGAGGGPAVWETDPCDAPQAFAKSHGLNFIKASSNAQPIKGTAGRDLIVGTDGDDHIWGAGGADVICAGYGEDWVHGDDGNDYIDGGGDNDHLYGDEGDDLVHGRGGSDVIFGGNGADILLGDILDDKLYGEAGNDLLIGGHGTDIMMGGTGNDYLRGDTGNDAFVGGPGNDVASFITAMPPGQGQKVNAPPSAIDGVKIDFTDDCKETGFGFDDLQRTTHDGCANGDGGNEPLDGIEDVLGSPYDDVFLGGKSGVLFRGGFGDDHCDGKPCGKGDPAPAGTIYVGMDDTPRDLGLVVRGSDQSDVLDIAAQNGKLVVRVKNGRPITTSGGCNASGATVTCFALHTVRFIAAWMGNGNDVLKLESEVAGSGPFPRDITAHASGGEGDDWLHGGNEQDVFFTGPRGADHLFGNGGSDALLSESRKWPGKDCSNLTPQQKHANPFCDENKPDGASYDDGADELRGGPGDDQLVTDYPCGGHVNSGGGGKDIAGFARSGRFDLVAQLAGKATIEKAFHGMAYNPQLCGLGKATKFEDDLEILEAADGDDELWGNDAPNVIWGREGDDHLHGLAGNDVLEGLLGQDKVWGGAGDDVITGAEDSYPDAD